MSSAREVLQQHAQRLRRFAYALTGTISDADDLTHDVIVKVLEKGLPELDDPIPWLLKMTKNLWIDQLRYRELRKTDESDGSEEIASEHSASLLQTLHTQRVLIALAGLSEKYRLALTLVAVEGMSYEETARILDIPVGTVMSRVARAREHMISLFHTSEVDQ